MIKHPHVHFAATTQLHDDSTRRILKSLAVIMLVVLCGWTMNAVIKLSMAPLGVGPLGLYIEAIIGAYFVQSAAGCNAPVLYAFRYVW